MKRLEEVLQELNLTDLKKVAKRLKLKSFTTIKKYDLVRKIISEKKETEINKIINPPIWRKYQIHIYGFSSVIGLILTIIIILLPSKESSQQLQDVEQAQDTSHSPQSVIALNTFQEINIPDSLKWIAPQIHSELTQRLFALRDVELVNSEFLDSINTKLTKYLINGSITSIHGEIHFNISVISYPSLNIVAEKTFKINNNSIYLIYNTISSIILYSIGVQGEEFEPNNNISENEIILFELLGKFKYNLQKLDYK